MSPARIELLRKDGWIVTERGFMRGPLRTSATVTLWDGSRTSIPMLRRIASRPSRKFRRFPFVRNTNENPLIGWFNIRSEYYMEKFGGLKELNQMSLKSGAYAESGDDAGITRVEASWIMEGFFVTIPKHNSSINWDLIHPNGNNRQGWKFNKDTGEVEDFEGGNYGTQVRKDVV